MTIVRCAALAVTLAACGARRCPTTTTCPPPPAQAQTMLEHDDSTAPAALFAVDLALTADPPPGRAQLRILFRGKAAITLAVPHRIDQIEWFDPQTKTLRVPTPYLVWSAWRIDNAALVLDSRTSTAQRASKYITLHAGEAHELAVDIAAALDGLRGTGTFTRGWCARAWLIGGTHPLPSNIVCWLPEK